MFAISEFSNLDATTSRRVRFGPTPSTSTEIRVQTRKSIWKSTTNVTSAWSEVLTPLTRVNYTENDA